MSFDSLSCGDDSFPNRLCILYVLDIICRRYSASTSFDAISVVVLCRGGVDANACSMARGRVPPNALSFAVGLPSVKRALAFVFGKDHIIHFRYLTFPRRS